MGNASLVEMLTLHIIWFYMSDKCAVKCTLLSWNIVECKFHVAGNGLALSYFPPLVFTNYETVKNGVLGDIIRTITIIYFLKLSTNNVSATNWSEVQIFQYKNTLHKAHRMRGKTAPFCPRVSSQDNLATIQNTSRTK